MVYGFVAIANVLQIVVFISSDKNVLQSKVSFRFSFACSFVWDNVQHCFDTPRMFSYCLNLFSACLQLTACTVTVNVMTKLPITNKGVTLYYV